jgi:MCP family monocarboxylic acid transporter-like MFS transporter 3
LSIGVGPEQHLYQRIEVLSMATVEYELSHTHTGLSSRPGDLQSRGESEAHNPTLDDAAPEHASTAIPDGGYGWVVLVSCSVITFWFAGLTGSWGVIQTALLSSTLQGTPSSTTAFVGSLGITICVAFGLIAVRLMQIIGVRSAAVFGISLVAIGTLASGFTTTNVTGLFQTFGVVLGIGDCLCYTASNIMPAQYFSRRIGLANAIIKLGGGLGATILSVSLNSLINQVGVAWMFRILGLVMLATGLPAALAIKERIPQPKVPVLDLALFKQIPFVAIFLAGVTATFTLFVPPFFLPLFAQSIGLSNSVGAGLVAAFNACNTVGRFAAGPLCDRIGPLNTFVITVGLNALTTLAIWPVSSTVAPLVIFITVNGVANGAFFTTLPIVVASMVDPSRAAVAMSMSITGWTGGYLLGPAIAGYLLEASGAGETGKNGPAAYRSAIFYAGGLATLSSAFVLTARLLVAKKVLKKV